MGLMAMGPSAVDDEGHGGGGGRGDDGCGGDDHGGDGAISCWR